MDEDQEDPGRAMDAHGAGRRRMRPHRTPIQRALALLVRREHSRRELIDKLTARGLEHEEVVAAVDRLAGEGWQDDARFAEQMVRSRAGAGYGPIRIRAELSVHGLDDDAIEAAMATFGGDWVELARSLVMRRHGVADSLSDLSVRRKAADMLARRGFTGEQIRIATRFDPDELA
ncbi:regulatory protein RecX [Marilutibacter chinensis]|uniref:Regulatory protein RecX n=1 Tax=Marilutibacter chinensis TaxID=2912247 RepID=A0ABS9HSB5_9GAMM|nr:regulatory protein RecX [Lysobacter chinensis]MCF7220957.1 recombination regulator RecX [Lysobacter chinensis]